MGVYLIQSQVKLCYLEISIIVQPSHTTECAECAQHTAAKNVVQVVGGAL